MDETQTLQKHKGEQSAAAEMFSPRGKTSGAVFFMAIAFGMGLASGCSVKEPRIESRRRIIMDTLVEIKAPEGHADAIFDAAFSEMERIDAKYNAHSASSAIFGINSSRTPQSLDGETLYLLEFALNISSCSGGALDPALGLLSSLWKNSGQKIPPPKAVANALKKSGVGRLRLSSDGILFKDSAVLDFGAFAKGYAVDRAIAAMISAGASEGLVNAGGDIGVFGDKTWRIAVKHPRKPSEFLGIMPLRGKAVATSGDYERFKEINAMRYHHIIDPATGMPADRGAISATVIAGDCLTADALSTAVFVLGPTEGLKLAEKMEGVECVIVDESGGIHKTSGLKNIPFVY